MKKHILVAVFLSFATFAIGQLPFSFGPKIGLNISKLSTDVSAITTAAKSGLQIGAFVRLGNKTYIQPELMFSGRGGIFEGITPDKNSNFSLKTLDIPVLIGTKVINAPLAKLRIYAGPVASFVLTKSWKIGDIEQAEDDIKLKNAIWSATVGAGVDILMLTLDVRYELGLNNISSDNSSSVKNNMWNISLGWKIL
jgi:hypothetical protein